MGRWGRTGLALLATTAVQVVSALPEPDGSGGGSAGGLGEAVSRLVFAPGAIVLNLLHLPVFAAIAWLWCRSAAAWLPSRRGALVAGVLIAALFALVNEGTQRFAPTRHASAADVAADLAGVALGGALFARRRRLAAPESEARRLQ